VVLSRPPSLSTLPRAAPASIAKTSTTALRAKRRPSRGEGSSEDEDDYDPGREAVQQRRRAAAAAAAAAPAAAAAAPTTPTTATTRLKLVVAYDGSNFAGFQFQSAGVRTVQGELEKGLSRVFGLRGRVVGAGRTDGGAHARGMCAHVDVAPSSSQQQYLDDLELATLHLNGHLPPDVKVVRLERAPSSSSPSSSQPPPPIFDAQASALGKEYHYCLSVSSFPDPFERRWWAMERYMQATRGRPPSVAAFTGFDFAAVRAALAALANGGAPRDFTALSDNRRPSGLGAQKRKRPKLAARLEAAKAEAAEAAAGGREAASLPPLPAPPKLSERSSDRNTRTLWRAECLDEGERRVRLVLAGDGFLYHQVRVTAAAMLEIGQGRIKPDDFLRAVEARDRRLGGAEAVPPFEAAPASGLCLERVFYPGDEPGVAL
jgi:tRNA pseudouridine38-40 synthase